MIKTLLYLQELVVNGMDVLFLLPLLLQNGIGVAMDSLVQVLFELVK